MLFIFSDKEIMAYFLVYVDDIILIASFDDFVSMVITNLRKEFALEDMGPLSYFLVIRISNLENGEILVS